MLSRNVGKELPLLSA